MSFHMEGYSGQIPTSEHPWIGALQNLIDITALPSCHRATVSAITGFACQCSDPDTLRMLYEC